ncbi:MAG: exosortase system-associated protein, TIGR04073 family [Desulfuromonadales bacterium]|nr:MAG: exosortase system-associated protein, TIGR04073 family [Desulfuromonadales bacterium]
MRSFAWFLALMVTLSCSAPLLAAQDEPKAEFIAEKMAAKLVRGITNMATSIVELPKQSYLTVRDRGDVGYVVGPLKGVIMTVYRAFIGATETAFFLVPQPGYYDPMIDPDYVWKGWEETRKEPLKAGDTNGSATEPDKGVTGQ